MENTEKTKTQYKLYLLKYNVLKKMNEKTPLSPGPNNFLKQRQYIYIILSKSNLNIYKSPLSFLCKLDAYDAIFSIYKHSQKLAPDKKLTCDMINVVPAVGDSYPCNSCDYYMFNTSGDAFWMCSSQINEMVDARSWFQRHCACLYTEPPKLIEWSDL